MGDHYYQSDTAAADSDKSFTVPESSMWHVDAVTVKLTGSATGGNRRPCVEFKDTPGNVVAFATAGATTAATEVRYYTFWPGAPNLTSFIGGATADHLSTPLPEMLLRKGWTVRVYDIAAIAADSDAMEVFLNYTQERTM